MVLRPLQLTEELVVQPLLLQLPLPGEGHLAFVHTELAVAD